MRREPWELQHDGDQQMRGICSPDGRSSSRPLPNALSSSTSRGCSIGHFADEGAAVRRGMRRQNPEGLLGRRRIDNRDEPALRWPRRADRVPAVRRRRAPAARPESPTRAGPCRRRHDRRSQSRPRPVRRVSDRAGSGVGHPRRVKWPTRSANDAQSLSGAPSNCSPSRCDMMAMPWRPMSPLSRILSPTATRDGWTSMPARHHADTGRVDEDAVGLAAIDHLRVAGDDPHAHLFRRLLHRLHDAPDRLERRAFLEDQAATQIQAAAPAMARSLTVP